MSIGFIFDSNQYGLAETQRCHKRPNVNYLAVPNMKVVQTWFEASEDGILWVFQTSYFAVAKARFLP